MYIYIYTHTHTRQAKDNRALCMDHPAGLHGARPHGADAACALNGRYPCSGHVDLCQTIETGGFLFYYHNCFCDVCAFMFRYIHMQVYITYISKHIPVYIHLSISLSVAQVPLVNACSTWATSPWHNLSALTEKKDTKCMNRGEKEKDI